MLSFQHLIMLSVGTNTAEEHARTFQDLSELHRNLAFSHDYASLTSQAVSEVSDDDEVECDREHLYHDEQTLFKVRRIFIEHGVSPESVDDLINDLHNAGLLFRERVGE